MQHLWLYQIFTHPIFKNIVVPLITLFLAIIFKASSKKNFSMDRFDFFVCFDLCVSALFLYFYDVINLANKLKNPPNQDIVELLEASNQNAQSVSTLNTLKELIKQQNQILSEKFTYSLALLCLIFLIIVLLWVYTRTSGWEHDKLKLWDGIILPDVIGFILLVIASEFI